MYISFNQYALDPTKSVFSIPKCSTTADFCAYIPFLSMWNAALMGLHWEVWYHCLSGYSCSGTMSVSWQLCLRYCMCLFYSCNDVSLSPVTMNEFPHSCAPATECCIWPSQPSDLFCVWSASVSAHSASETPPTANRHKFFHGLEVVTVL